MPPRLQYTKTTRSTPKLQSMRCVRRNDRKSTPRATTPKRHAPMSRKNDRIASVPCPPPVYQLNLELDAIRKILERRLSTGRRLLSPLDHLLVWLLLVGEQLGQVARLHRQLLPPRCCCGVVGSGRPSQRGRREVNPNRVDCADAKGDYIGRSMSRRATHLVCQPLSFHM